MVITLPTLRETKAAAKNLEAYHLALGKVAHAWNHMQDELAELFCTVINTDRSIGLALWHSLTSDRNQRGLLKAAAEAADLNPDWHAKYPKAKTDIAWAITKINGLTDGRNSAIHAPMFSSLRRGVVPYLLSHNPNAFRLHGKDVLAEFEWYEEYFRTIRIFAGAMTGELMKWRWPNDERKPWPGRPLLPTVKQKKSHQGQRHQPDQEQPVHPREP